MRFCLGAVTTRVLADMTCAVTLGLVLAGCGGDTTGARSSPSSSPASPTSAGAIDVAALPDGAPPQVDTIVGSTLFHDGKAIRLDHSEATGLGSVDGTAYVTTRVTGGEQLHRVGEGGALTAVGTPHETYDHLPRMSAASGHVFFVYSDRDTAKTTVTVVDARTGEVLDELQDPVDLSALDPGDRPVLEAMGIGARAEGGAVLAVSPDGATGLAIPADTSADPTEEHVVEQWSLGPKPSVVGGLTFANPANTENEESVNRSNLAFEDDDTFLVEAYEPRASAAAPIRSFVVRCTLDGECERASTSTPVGVSIAGAGGVFVPGTFEDN